MTHILETGHRSRSNGHASPFAGVPRNLAAIMRKELPDLATEIISEIRTTIPEYARPMNGPYGQAIRLGVEQALTAFVDQVANPGGPHDARDEVCRRLGQYEAHEGRGLDSLQAAYRIGTRVSWHRVMKVAQQYNLSLATISQLADALFGFMDELASLSRQGYLEAQARSADVLEHWRRRLLRLILECPPAPSTAIIELAGLASWPVPNQVTMVAMRPLACDKSLLDTDVLAELDAVEPHLLVPGPLTAQRTTMLQLGLAGSRIAVGPAVELASAAQSLRWSRQALALAEDGRIEAGAVVLCEEHLTELLLMSDTALVDQIAKRELGALGGMNAHRRHRLTETLTAWLEGRGSAARMAEKMAIHPQTVRYRMRQIEQIFGEQLDDPDSRFALDLVMRVGRLRERAARPGRPRKS
ncbi:MAG TPA: helix-turn-helix domain-containing protein [Rugosimonospora sp.]|jgi:hypothetical protein